jgi:hypothetical protein
MVKKKSAIDSMIDEGDSNTAAPATEDGDTESQSRPIYKKYPEARIPVSKSTGTLWKSRFDQAISQLKARGTHDAWDECVAYYKKNQTNKRNRDDPDAPSLGPESELTGGPFSRTENIVFSNVSSLVPAIYAKNPDVSVFNNKGEEGRQFATTAQKLVRTLLQKRTAPGINLKPKARVSVVRTTLMNISYIEIGYTKKEMSSDVALQQIDEISSKLAKAKTSKEVIELEGQLQAIDDTIDLLQPSGPYARALHPKDVIVDPDATVPDLSDAKWIMVHDVLDTSFLNAVYRTKDPETGLWSSLYKPTHVLKREGTGEPNMAGHDDEISSFNLFAYDDDAKHSSYGYEDERSFRRAQRTYVWNVWDKTTRRVLMYAENDWKWPVWVWDDPYGLDDFFMQFPLAFHTDPEDMYAKGEVSYYLDQQDELNLINSQISRMRWRVSNQIVVNKRAVSDETSIMSLIKPVKGGEIVTIDIPEGMKISDVLTTPPVPSVEYAQLFDKRQIFEAVDRVSGVSAVLRNVEFKTNTTNRAIDTYESSTQQRLDEKIDAIEELIGRVGYAVLCTCLQFMSQDEVAKLIGQEEAAKWPPNMSAREAQDSYNLTVTGGSSLKPTSKTRKAQAREIGQVLGQFGANNALAFYITLKLFARAYSDELDLDPGDWGLIIQSIEQQIQQQQAGPPQQQGAGAPAASGGAPASPQQGGAPQQGGPQQAIQMFDQLLQSLPPPIRQKFGAAVAQGVPLPEILAQLQQARQQGNGQQPQPPQGVLARPQAPARPQDMNNGRPS